MDNDNTTTQGPRPYVNPYLAGTILGIVLFLAFFITGGGIGASAGLQRIQVGVMKLFAQSHIDRVGYFGVIGGSGRNPWLHYAIYMVAGTLLGGFLSGLVGRRVKLEFRKGPHVTNATRAVGAFVGGGLMGFGARLARGCTSGQALSGGATMSVGSFAFAFAVFGGAYAVAWFFRRLWL